MLKADDCNFQLEPVTSFEHLQNTAIRILGLQSSQNNLNSSTLSKNKETDTKDSELFDQDDTEIIPDPSSSFLSVFMINCGGNFDVLQSLPIPDHTKVYIFDSHRPFDLMNVDENNKNVG